MLDLADILDFFDVVTGDAFDVPPEQAVEYFKAKGLRPTFSYADMVGKAHDHAFTVAKMMDVDMLSQMRASLDSAMANGTPFREWADSITPILQSGGWWGRKEVVDPLTGQTIVAQLGSPWRLETIFRTNMQSSYAAGAWQEIAAQADLAPFLMYDAVDDLRTRPLHASWDRKVLPVDSKWWKTHYPPNGWNCRCGVIQLDEEQVKALGLTVADEPPKDGAYLWTNPRTGTKVSVPNGIDPGFDHNPGMTFEQDTKELLAQKIAALDAEQMAAAQQAMAKAAAYKAELEASTAAAQKAIAKAEGEAALARSLAKAKEASAQWSAQQQIDAIAKGKETAGKGAANKIKALSALKKADAWPDLKPTERLAQINALAAEYKAKAELTHKLYHYKKAVVAGKIPTAANAQAFNSLDDAAKAEVLKAIEVEQAKLAAAKAAADAAAAAEAAKVAKIADATAPSTLVETQPPNPASMVVVARKTKGGTAGAVYQDTETGVKWMVKFNGSEDAVRNEVLSAKLYNLAGVEAPDLHAIVIDGRPALASRMVDGISEVDAVTLAKTASVQEGFAVDAWLANWDVAGMDYDNTVLIGGRALRIDVGGALRYRAVGGLKGNAFGDLVGEFESMRDASLNRQSADVFGRITQAQLEAGAVKVLRVQDDAIRALVARYGPTDPEEARKLADRLIARKADVARRFPRAAEIARNADAIAEAPVAKPPRITATEQEFVEQARVNGYGFPTDSDQIEDNMVIVHAYRKADGADATRGWFKLRPDASKELAKRIAETAVDSSSVNLGTARQKILDAIKSINFRAANSQVLDAKVVVRIEEMNAAVAAMRASIEAAIAKAANPSALIAKRDALESWAARVGAVLDDARAGKIATKIDGVFPVADFPDALDYVPKTAGEVPAGLRWRKVTGTYQYNAANFDRSFATEGAGTGQVYGADLRYEAELPDGTRIVYFPHDSDVAWAMQGIVKIDATGRGIDSTSRIFEAMDAAGLKSTRATELDRKHLYLSAFARIRLIRGDAASYRGEFEAITGHDEDALRRKLAVLKKATGVDVEASEGWRNVDGVRQAFGHGRAYQLRPDLDPVEMAALEVSHVVYHNPKGLSWDAGPGVFERVKTIIDGGGIFSSLTDRVRRGVPLSGSSVSQDLSSGGGDYHFTRLGTREIADGTGVYWRVSTLRRMDAITYEADMFGETRGDSIERNRRGQEVQSLKATAYGSGGARSNETIFKGGLSIFDDLDRIVLSSAAEVKEAVAWMKSKGYARWPDGRALDEVIITKAKHGKR